MTSAAQDGNVGAFTKMVQIAKNIEDMKQEHRVEITFLKKENASLRNKAKILSKERDELANAYEAQRSSNGDLENLLDKFVKIF